MKDEHEKFLLSLDSPKFTNIPREKIIRWHPEFDVDSCKEIEKAELPQPLDAEKRTARDVLGKNFLKIVTRRYSTWRSTKTKIFMQFDVACYTQ